jgi:hypothetical protein
MNVFRWSATALIISAALATAAPAEADGDSYIRYLNDHGIFVPGINDAVRISRGSLCTSTYAESSMPHSTSSARTPWGIEAWKRSTMPRGAARPRCI